MKALQLIIVREFLSRVKTKAFILTTLLTPLLMIAVMVLPAAIMSMKNTDIETVYVIDKTGLYAPLFEDKPNFSFEVLSEQPADNKTEAATALLQINADLSKTPKAVTFYSEMQKPPAELTEYINSVLTDAVKNSKLEAFAIRSEIDGETTAKIKEIVNAKEAININTYRWDESGETKDTVGELASAVGFVFTFVMFFFVMMYGSLVMQSVVEEKTNRIIEVIISSVKPFYLMMGKIIGVALTGLTQIGVWILIIGLGLGAYSMLGGLDLSSSDMEQAMEMANHNKLLAGALNSQIESLFAINWFQVVACFILYFIGGYLLYAALFAMFGSAANDSQEAQQFVTPLMVILMIAFYVGFAAAKNPEGSAAIWGSIIPFTAPVVMMVRTPFEIPFWHILLSLVLLYATAILMIMLAAKIYRTGILMYGKKVSFGEIFKWLNYK